MAEPVVLVIRGPLAPSDAAVLCSRVQDLVSARDGDADLVVCDVATLEPDAATLEVLARVALAVHRLGCELRLRDPCAGLRDLVSLTGLADVLPVWEP